MNLYIWLLCIVMVISLIGFLMNNAEVNYLSNKSSRINKKSRKKSKRHIKKHKQRIK